MLDSLTNDICQQTTFVNDSVFLFIPEYITVMYLSAYA